MQDYYYQSLLQFILIEKTIKKLIFLIKSRLFKNSFYTGISLLFIGFTPSIFNFLVARFFGPKTLGEINVTINFCLLITIFITNFFGSSGNKLLAEYRGRKNKSNFIYTFKIIFFGSMGTLIISCISLFFLWEYIFKRFSLSEELLFPIIIFIFLRTVYILLRKTFYGVDLVKQYTLNEILSAIVMLLMIGYVCIYNWPKLLIHTYLISYSCFIMLGVNTLIKNWKKITKKMDMPVDFSRKNVIREFSIYKFFPSSNFITLFLN